VGADEKTMRPLGERRSVAEEAAARMREAILSGVYEQGERLSDSRIAEELGTSRGPIREALKLLQAEGLVVQKPNRGAFVISPSAEDMRDTCELRVALESHAARLLAARRSPEDVAVLRAVADAFDAAVASGDRLAVSQADKDFHERLCLLSGSRRLYDVFVRDVQNVLGFFGLDAEAYQPLSEMGREFRPLLAAIERGDQDLAASLVADHIRRATELLAARMEL